MRENLEKYLRSLFADAAHSPANEALFEELLGNLRDRYDELIASGKSEDQAYAAAIGEIGDIRPLLEREEPREAQYEPIDPTAAARTATQSEQEAGLPAGRLCLMKILSGLGNALSVMLFILWLVPTILWDMAFSIFVFAALGVVTLVCTHNLIPKYTDDSARSFAPAMRRLCDILSAVLLAGGIGCCILSILPAAILQTNLGPALMFLIVAFGVGMIIFSRYIRPKLDRRARKDAPTCDRDEAPKQKSLRWILPVVIVCCVLLSCAVLVGMAMRYDFQFGFFFTDGNLALYTNAGDAVIEEGVTGIHVDWIAGNVTVMPYEGDKVEIVETQNGAAVEPGEEQMRWYVSGGALHIRFDGKSKFGLRWGNVLGKDLTVRVPQKQLHTIRIDAVSGNVKLQDLTVESNVVVDSVSGAVSLSGIVQKQLKINTVSGDIAIDGGNADRLELDSVSGALTVKSFLCGTLEIDQVSGKVTLESIVFDTMQLDTVSGDISITLAAIAREIELDTVGANVKIFVPADLSGFSAELDSTSGELASTLPTTKKGDTLVFGDGAMRIEMDSTGGDLSIEYAQ